jgi:D-alanyl-D-alanine carboxypeptidase/D-alanyl-D-alanine-endopeptidase (penicillin-binding protein 4)
VNFNSLTFLVRPAEQAGAPATIQVEPFPLPNLTLENEVMTLEAGSTPVAIEATRTMDGERETWVLKGAVCVGAPVGRIYRACRSPALFAGGVLRGLLGQHGIHVAEVRTGEVPTTAIVIDSLTSLSLGVLVRSMNLWSNNFMADLLLADLGEGRSAAAGAERIRDWLRVRVGMKDLPAIEDGCGLSPADRISAGQIVSLLLWAHAHERVLPDLYASFPRPRGPGTLERRFRNGPAPSLRAKTGTLGDYGVSSIAGYVDGPGGSRYAFCILQQANTASGLRVSDLREREESWLREFVAP